MLNTVLYGVVFADIRSKLDQQLKCLEQKMESQCSMVMEAQEFFRKRAEIELDYSQKLDKLARVYLSKQKSESQKKLVGCID